MCDCGDGPETYRETRPRARKPHKCCECGRTIQPGEIYRLLWGVWEGRPETYKTCSACQDLDAWAHDQSDCFCPTLGDLRQHVIDMVHESGEADIIAEGERRVKEIERAARIAATAT
jgi:hypothetical protein